MLKESVSIKWMDSFDYRNDLIFLNVAINCQFYCNITYLLSVMFALFSIQFLLHCACQCHSMFLVEACCKLNVVELVVHFLGFVVIVFRFFITIIMPAPLPHISSHHHGRLSTRRNLRELFIKLHFLLAVSFSKSFK